MLRRQRTMTIAKTPEAPQLYVNLSSNLCVLIKLTLFYSDSLYVRLSSNVCVPECQLFRIE